LSNGSSGVNRFTLFQDGTFTDAVGNTGIWRFFPPSTAFLQYAPGQFCQARFIGQLQAGGVIQGNITCQDGSGVTGTWVGRVTPATALGDEE
ncbi:MAG: hypothetical protein ACRDIB_08155, partial [Ardenticatenaceae bacterium]